jgi:hypothetical protein
VKRLERLRENVGVDVFANAWSRIPERANYDVRSAVMRHVQAVMNFRTLLIRG